MLHRVVMCFVLCLGFMATVAYTTDLCDEHVFQENGCAEENLTDAFSDNLIYSETIDFPDFGGKVSIRYPEGWFVEDDNGSLILSNKKVLPLDEVEDFKNTPQDTIIISLTIIPSDMAGMLGVEGEVTPTSIIEIFSAFISGDDMPEFTAPIEFTINDHMTAASSGHDDDMQATLYAIDKGDYFVFAFYATHFDNIANIDLIESIIASTTFTETD